MGVVPQDPVLFNDTVMNRQGAASPQSSSCSFVFLSDLMKPQQHSSQSLVTSSVKIDDQDVRDVTLQSFRQAMGFFPQDPVLFNDTVMNNVRSSKKVKETV